MSDRRTTIKAALLAAPLLVSVLALHAWGDALAGGLGRAVSSWQYPERAHSSFLIRVPRRSDADVFAARALDEFVAQAVKAHGAALGLQPPLRPVQVVLLDPDSDPRRFGWIAAEDLKENEGLFDAERRMIIVRMERKLQQEPVIAALRRAAARLLLHDAGSAAWKPWLAEGLVGRLEGSKATDLKAWTGDLPSVNDLLTSREADFQGISGPAYARGARLLVAYLAEALPEGFAYYYKAERAAGPAPLQVFSDRFGDFPRLEDAWKTWLHAQK